VQRMHQCLHHFVANAPWGDAALLGRVRDYALPGMIRKGPVVAWIVDDTAFVKRGTHSVGVVRQYCGQVGKQEKCRMAVSLSVATGDSTLARRPAPAPSAGSFHRFGLMHFSFARR
jgi:SRSO17 transposase